MKPHIGQRRYNVVSRNNEPQVITLIYCDRNYIQSERIPLHFGLAPARETRKEWRNPLEASPKHWLCFHLPSCHTSGKEHLDQTRAGLL